MDATCLYENSHIDTNEIPLVINTVVENVQSSSKAKTKRNSACLLNDATSAIQHNFASPSTTNQRRLVFTPATPQSDSSIGEVQVKSKKNSNSACKSVDDAYNTSTAKRKLVIILLFSQFVSFNNYIYIKCIQIASRFSQKF